MVTMMMVKGVGCTVAGVEGCGGSMGRFVVVAVKNVVKSPQHES